VTTNITGKSQACAKTLLLVRVVGLVLIVLGLTTQGSLARSEVMVGTAGPLTALRTVAPLGWWIKVRNSSDATYAAVYTINGQVERKVLPPHKTTNVGYVLAREIPTFRFANIKRSER
jgi:hypothetical protein